MRFLHELDFPFDGWVNYCVVSIKDDYISQAPGNELGRRSMTQILGKASSPMRLVDFASNTIVLAK